MDELYITKSQTLQKLIKDASELFAKRKKDIGEHKKNGDFFNVFSILKLYSQEVNFHSAIIAELLDVNGSHGFGNLFLDEFIKSTATDDLEIKTNSYECETQKEVRIGKITEDDGGRIDILVRSNDKAIIIENKIYANDGHRQLVRYNNYATNKDNGIKKYKLLYLTLDGHEASAASFMDAKGNNVDYKCISYKSNIINWLNQCIKISKDIPKVNAVISQYKNIIQQLTNQTMKNNKIDQEIMNLLLSKENLETSINLIFEKDNIMREIIEKYIKPQLNSNDYDVTINLDGSNYCGINFYPKNPSKYMISYQFQSPNYCDMIWGICWQGNKFEKEHKLDIFEKGPTIYYPFGFNYLPDNLKDWNNSGNLMQIINEELKKYIYSNLQDLSRYFNMQNLELKEK